MEQVHHEAAIGRARVDHPRPVDAEGPPLDLVGADELYTLGLRRMAEPAGAPRRQAIDFRDGLIIALLAARPLRRRNLAGLREQMRRFLDFDAGSNAAMIVNNHDWIGRFSFLEFLRDVGKNFPVNVMLAKDSVQLRLAAGLSFTEFSYMTLQAADFLHLYREHGVEMQMGGADQWGNITAGLELIRRVEGAGQGDEPRAFALCSPLLATSDGQKMGKTQSGAVYLDATLTRPFDFYQYLVNQPDEIVGRLLRWLTLLDVDEVASLEAEQARQPDRRPGQRAFAFDLTRRVHGPAEAERQRRVADALFGTEPLDDPARLSEVFDEIGGFQVDASSEGGLTAARTAVASGLFTSRGEVRRAIAQGGLSVNDHRVGGLDEAVEPLAGGWLVVRAGKRRVAVGRLRR